MARKFDPLPQPRRGRRTRLAQALVLVALLLIAAAVIAPRLTASAFEASPASPAPSAQPFKGRTLTYRDESGFARDVATAAERWNAVGAHVRLRPAARGTDAEITITSVTRRNATWAGRTLVGCDLDAGPCRPDRPQSIVINRRDMRGSARIAIVVHEFGHALGLPHHSGCSIMRPRGPVRCGREYACGPQGVDASALTRLWGGVVSPTFHPIRCPTQATKWRFETAHAAR